VSRTNLDESAFAECPARSACSTILPLVPRAPAAASTAYAPGEHSALLPNIPALLPPRQHLVLLAVSGMRIGEAINLKLKGMDLAAGVLTIEGGKFDQSRLVPVHSSTQAALANYKLVLDEYLNTRGFDSPYFFTTQFGSRLDRGDIHRNFFRLSNMIGLRGSGPNTGPRIHDLRHRFAVETLLQWYRNGEDVERKLPMLSTYLGHVKVKDTYWYLTACPELMGQAVNLVERRWEKDQ